MQFSPRMHQSPSVVETVHTIEPTDIHHLPDPSTDHVVLHGLAAQSAGRQPLHRYFYVFSALDLLVSDRLRHGADIRVTLPDHPEAIVQLLQQVETIQQRSRKPTEIDTGSGECFLDFRCALAVAAINKRETECSTGAGVPKRERGDVAPL